MKSLIRPIRQEIQNWLVRLRHEGLRLDGSVETSNCKFSRFNMVCKDSIVSNCSFGDYSYVGARCKLSRATIGKFCSIGPNVTIAPGKHPVDFISTHPIFYSKTFPCDNRIATEQRFEESNGVQIGHDVWIGNRVTILDGVTIGTGAILAAHSIVTKDVEPYAIVGGVPAKVIRSRFSSQEITQLLEAKWWDQDDDFLRQHVELFASPKGISELIKTLQAKNTLR